MLKHCHNSSIRLQRRCVNGNVAPDAISINSTLTVQSSTGSTRSSSGTNESVVDTSFINHIEDSDHQIYTTGGITVNVNTIATDTNCDNVVGSVFNCSPAPISISSRASSFSSLSDSEGPKTTIKVYASCLRPDIEYKTLAIANSTTAKNVIWQLLSKFKMRHRDPKLFYLSLEVTIQKSGREGLTKKTLMLDDDSKPAELKQCNPWGECKFTLQTKKGGLVRIHDSVLMQESQYKSLYISEDTTVDEVIVILLHCYGLEKVDRAERYCLYEQCVTQHYQRKLHPEDKPLKVASLWIGPTQFSFVLRHNFQNHSSDSIKTVNIDWAGGATASLRNNNPVAKKIGEQVSSIGGYFEKRTSNDVDDRLWPNMTKCWTTFRPLPIDSETVSSSSSPSSLSSCSPLSSEPRTSPWPEVDKDSEELRTCCSTGSEDMDTSLSSSDSPTPPALTSTPLHAKSNRLLPRPQVVPHPLNVKKPVMSFLFPSPNYDTFPSTSVPSRPYSSMQATSTSSIPSPACSTFGVRISVAPMVPPKPSGPHSLYISSNKTPSAANLSCHDYENYFYI